MEGGEKGARREDVWEVGGEVGVVGVGCVICMAW